jgi:hypothetical protein
MEFFMSNQTNEVPVTVAEVVRLVDVVMADDPRELRELGIMTVYKNPRTNIIAISEIALGLPASQYTSYSIFEHRASTGFLVQLSIPEDCYNEVFQSLINEPLITKINGVRTLSGQTIESISHIINRDSEQHSCIIM